jgi:hypothetical protein
LHFGNFAEVHVERDFTKASAIIQQAMDGAPLGIIEKGEGVGIEYVPGKKLRVYVLGSERPAQTEALREALLEAAKLLGDEGNPEAEKHYRAIAPATPEANDNQLNPT